MKNITFVVPGYPEGPYSSIVDMHIEPLLKLLDDYTLWPEVIPGSVNVCLFTTDDGDVFMSHGIADKAYRDYRAISKYSHVFVSGPAWAKKMANQGVKGNVHKVGYPAMDCVFDIDGEPISESSNNLVIAPTHTNSLSCYSWFKENLEAIYAGSGGFFNETILSPHPFDELRERRTVDEILDASVVVADTGSTVYEAWALGKPVVFPDWVIRNDRGSGLSALRRGTFEWEIYHSDIGRHAHTLGQFFYMLDEAQRDGITQEEKAFIEDIFPEAYRGRSAQIAADTLKEIACEF